MNISQEKLLQSGFTQKELRKIKINVERFGGTLDMAIQDLACRFRLLTWITAVCAVIFILLVVFSSPVKIIAGGVAFVFGIAIMMFAQPPILSYKSWRYWRNNRC